jgi:immune inhibitor A
VANVVGDRGGPGVYGYQRRAVEPPAARRLARGDAIADSVAQFGVDYYEIVEPEDGTIRFHGARIVAALSGVAEPTMVWVPTRADGSASHLACSAVAGPGPKTTLAYRVWFDIERNYDFAYVSMSRDGGRTWGLLHTPQMTQNNDAGNNLGGGYTGKSGAGEVATWLEQAIELDVSPGEPVLIRFSYVTDDAVTREGIALDAVRLVDSDSGATRPCPEWSPQGWASIGPTLPQRWLVQAIEFVGDGIRVQPVPLDDAGIGVWSAGGRQVDRIVLAVAAVTPATLQRAAYGISRPG